MMLADMGADVLRIERANAPAYVPPIDPTKNVLHRGRRTLTLDLKSERGVATLLRLTDAAHVLMEGFRPGVMERLGVGPEICCARNPRLIYARMTGWGQTGPMAHLAGHDINYFAMSGSLHLSGRADETPCPNLNLVADMGGGGMMMAFGIACALLETGSSGRGQIIDAAMMEGAALLAAQIHGYRAMGRWSDERGTNLLDSGAPFYDVYRTADGGYMAVGAIEAPFYANLLMGLGLDPAQLPKQHDRAHWPEIKRRFAELFSSKTRREWTQIFASIDACTTPVLTPDEAAGHPHLVARGSFGAPAGVQQPMPAPRFSRTPGAIHAPPPEDDAGGYQAMREWGLSELEIEQIDR
jgi:alpha-methylacyl-CoA racemase